MVSSNLVHTINGDLLVFQDLPWHRPLLEWANYCNHLEEFPHGVSRHPVVFVNYDGKLYALKELPPSLAAQEYSILNHLVELRLPAVVPVGYVQTHTAQGKGSILITQYLERSIPYRLLFARSNLLPYRAHLLDAVAGLLVQLHLFGIFWGDCSLSNVLFRRDAGTLQAYLVDAETTESHDARLAPALRCQDLEIMQENLTGELQDLEVTGLLRGKGSISTTGTYICQQYQHLWDEITREEILVQKEHYRIQERIRALNKLGFSIGDIELRTNANGESLHLRVIVTDRYFHRDKLYKLTGLEAEEMQAQKLMNEIHEVKATLSQMNNRSISLSVAAQRWLADIYQPTVSALEVLMDRESALAELYCQVLEHKWYLSERAHQDVGHISAVEDYILWSKSEKTTS
jgi:hypothetical protein